MKENKTNWWVIISVAIVVAVVSSLITVSVTGNIIKQNTNPYGMYQLYTKPEIDSKLNSINLSLKNLNNSLTTSLTTYLYPRIDSLDAAVNKHTASLIVYSNPPDTSIWIDGAYSSDQVGGKEIRGLTPGNHTISVAKIGYKSYKTNIMLYNRRINILEDIVLVPN